MISTEHRADNPVTDEVEGIRQMSEVPRNPARGGPSRDGLAALAIVLLAAVLIAVMINHFV